MQELKQIKLIEAIGKKISDVKVGYEKHIIKFEDGTFSFFERYEDWGSEHQSDIKIEYQKFIERLQILPDGRTYFTTTQRMFIDLGILDGEKLIEDAQERIKKVVSDAEIRERKKYEELKAKFENLCKKS